MATDILSKSALNPIFHELVNSPLQGLSCLQKGALPITTGSSLLENKSTISEWRAFHGAYSTWIWQDTIPDICPRGTKGTHRISWESGVLCALVRMYHYRVQCTNTYTRVVLLQDYRSRESSRHLMRTKNIISETIEYLSKHIALTFVKVLQGLKERMRILQK